MPGHDRRRTRPPEPKTFIHNPLALAKARAATNPVKPVAKSEKAAKKPTDAELEAGAVPAGEGAEAAAPKPQIDGDGKPYITLAQLLKKLALAPTGGAAKHLIRAGGITVAGVAEDRPGRKLHAGDKVSINGKEVTVSIDS